ncbi:MAG: 1-(5-phosphoribosyl)-5-[(5-phosphoribosylamino)methylideneamino] imidazole-4-carboxamide isomerase [Deltaproteobacteria bacterium]|nr:MAG: 1-(5-phosphoribosyl)-5-[(5-phosphoribosylamino)methylideneamino] imidazole-4-carboxamide isomerase [Deltaproteobacteria bacterium]TMB36239.1 MAG: 1-(5-phosphoribosyl)-5-[(5-phosphoribosylamino)methylideneamino] imidazole-4-carboxamide isomerase [Deltaproteobacteria bacterium]
MTRVLYPAIDLLAGRAVRLRQGERQSARVYSDDPPAQARAFVANGARYLHVVDLDAAFGEKRQTALIERIAQAVFPVPIQVGGGIRDLRAAEETLGAGAARIIFGTAAVERPALAGEAIARFGGERVACGIDVKEGKAAVRGWTDARGPAPARLATTLAGEGVEWLVVTAVAKDGTLEGFDLDLLRQVSEAAPQAKVIASGGAGDLSHLRALATAGIGGLAGAIAGTALYEGRFGVGEGQQALSC